MAIFFCHQLAVILPTTLNCTLRVVSKTWSHIFLQHVNNFKRFRTPNNDALDIYALALHRKEHAGSGSIDLNYTMYT